MKIRWNLLVTTLAVALALKASAAPERSGQITDETLWTKFTGTDVQVDSTGVVWNYCRPLDLWITAVNPRPMFCHSGGIGAAAYGLYSASALVSDTTSASAVGISYPESTVTVGLRWHNKKGQSPTDTTMIYKTPPGAVTEFVYKFSWAATDYGSVYGLAIFAGPGDIFEMFGKLKASGSVNPSSPFVYMMTYRFRRPQ